MASTAKGAPTKEFFVGMLTRDIELNDAILDLLDNCLDGVVRQKGPKEKRASTDYYKGYFSYITIRKDYFCVEDNCGGIPRDVAEETAFRMGRSQEKSEEPLPTVGIYGIGMKRAIFKIGRSAKVTTRNSGVLYQVTVPIRWAESDENWEFPIDDITSSEILPAGGTRIEIANINTSISDIWNTDDKIDNFTERLIKAVQQSYSFIIQKGFEITINGQHVYPNPIQLLITEKIEGSSIKPFLYKETFDDVDVSLAIGFYAPPPSPEDIDDENNLKRSSSDAGWTVVCNDRVVLYNDKTHVTGWGISGVPNYHTQFTGIRGIVIFESNNPKNLPMTTTKRGIDTSSKIYDIVKDRMIQGLKIFTDYTNRWKGQNERERTYSSMAKSISVEALTGLQSEIEANNPVEFHKYRGGVISVPDLPKPPSDKPYKVIRFSRDIEEILDIVEYLYADRAQEMSPSQVGEKCFDIILEKAHKKEDE